MSLTKHTPGPWRTDVPDPAFVNYDVRTDHKIICTMGIDMAVEEEAANARLIAAAPELLGALNGLLSACEKEATSIEHSFLLADEVAHWQDVARAAIAKATQP